MGTLDSILGNLMGMAGGQPQAFGAPGRPQGSPMGPAAAAGGTALVAMAIQLLQRNGGIQGVLQKFQQAGYSQQAQSWVTTGSNQAIDGDMFQKALTGGGIGQIASMLGLSRSEASSQMAGVLPDVIDKMTPEGRFPDGEEDLLSQSLAMLTGKTGRA